MRTWEGLSTRLQGRLVVLEPLSEDHADGLFAAARPEEIWEWWPFNPGSDRPTFDSWLAGALRAVADGEEARFATRDARSGRLVGSTSFTTLRPGDRGLEIGWTWLTPSAWNRGINAEAKLLQLRHAFEVLGCHRVEWETDEHNHRSRRALAALPATFEGILRDREWEQRGRFRSCAFYSVLEDEWPAVKENLEARAERHVKEAT